MPDELVYSIDSSKACRATPITLAEAGLRERTHLQQWILAHPEIIGEGVLIVTCEFDAWQSSSGPERDRLDVLALDRSGRLVVVELKRDRAPDTVELQAIKYAAMASRFTPEVLASQHAEFLRKHDNVVSDEEAMQYLVEHVNDELNPDLLRQPRIVLVASEFPPTVTATIVWLSEMGLGINLVCIRAYRTEREVCITVSQLYPVPDVEEFTVAPVRASARRARDADYPEIPWDAESLARLSEVATNPTVRAAMDLCAERPGEWVSIRELEAKGGRTQAEARADLAGLTMMVKRRFGRRNWPFEVQWAAGGDENAYYRMEKDVAATWRSAPLESGESNRRRHPDDQIAVGDDAGQETLRRGTD